MIRRKPLPARRATSLAARRLRSCVDAICSYGEIVPFRLTPEYDW